MKKEKKTKKMKKDDRPILLVKLGDKAKGWIPSESHKIAFIKMAKKVGLTDKFNLIIYHYGIEVELLGNDKKLEEYGLQIVDEKKFDAFTKKMWKKVKQMNENQLQEFVADVKVKVEKPKEVKTKEAKPKKP